MSESNPKSDPLILWLTGGPDCSALFSLLCEIGSIMLEPMEYGDYKPAQYNNSFPSLVLNPHTWIKGSGGNNLYLTKACVRPYLWSEHIVLRETGIAGLVPFAIGLETSGSITYPASHFGVMALRPTF
ncbi:hypothetical protein T459_14596 [Capsicum annuum]|uniref:Uncharacterized protein n=1 Tax=Capsicum annuum TaxID=4072 RepID=A0A2G2ZI35_CAPAN|nr:hypothetical protein T459_14596 [Capsicum annuum]